MQQIHRFFFSVFFYISWESRSSMAVPIKDSLRASGKILQRNITDVNSYARLANNSAMNIMGRGVYFVH